MIEVCVDANLAVMWYTPEDLRDKSVALLKECDRLDIRLIAPDHMMAEAASVIRTKLYRGLIDADEAWIAVSLLVQTQIDYVDVLELVPDAWRIAENYNLASLYDAYYLALAEGRGCDFWTADERFINSVRGVPFVRHIKDFTAESMQG